MKILIICEKFLPLSEQFLFNQLKALESHDVYLICRKQVNNKLHSFNFKKTWVWYDNLFMRLNIKVHKKDQLPPSIISKSKKIIQDNGIDLLFFHYGTTAVKYELLLENLNIPIFCAFHGFDATRKLRNSSYAKAIKRICIKIDKVIVPSYYISRLLVIAGINKDKIAVVRFGPDLNNLDRIPPVNYESNLITILHAGRLVPKKGIIDLVRTFISLSKKYSNLHLVLAGGGEQYKEIKTLVKKSRLKNIEMTNALSYNDMLLQFRRANIFVLNSRESEDGDMEGLPNTIMEAMSFRIPVISTKHSGIPELIQNMRNGILVNPKDNVGLEGGLELLINNRNLCMSLGEAGRMTIESSFNLELMKSCLEGLLKETFLNNRA